VCETNRNLFVDFLQQVWVSLLSTSVRAVYRSPVHRSRIRLSLPTRPDSPVPLQQRAACAQVSEARAMIVANQESCPSAIAAASVGLKDWFIPIVCQARSCSERVLRADAGLLYREQPNSIVVHEVTERNGW
jgi:hypothetical protein